MRQKRRSFGFGIFLMIAAVLSLAPIGSTAAQELPPPAPIDLPCVENVSAQRLAATPVGDGSQTLVLVRVILGPGGTIGAHTHPGTLAVVIESGTFGLTLLDHGEMMVTRAATADSEAIQEPMHGNDQLTLNPGDSFIEMGMIHSARNLDEGETTVLISGLIDTGEALTRCVDDATPSA
jgi:hypothetical protein